MRNALLKAPHQVHPSCWHGSVDTNLTQKTREQRRSKWYRQLHAALAQPAPPATPACTTLTSARANALVLQPTCTAAARLTSCRR